MTRLLTTTLSVLLPTLALWGCGPVDGDALGVDSAAIVLPAPKCVIPAEQVADRGAFVSTVKAHVPRGDGSVQTRTTCTFDEDGRLVAMGTFEESAEGIATQWRVERFTYREIGVVDTVVERSEPEPEDDLVADELPDERARDLGDTVDRHPETGQAGAPDGTAGPITGPKRPCDGDDDD